ncbi:MAG: DUF4912 domain-containing protein, partial [Planctomycetota bacterium]
MTVPALVESAACQLAPPGVCRLFGAQGDVVATHLAPDMETLRRFAWEISATKAGEAYRPPASHVGLAVVDPRQAFVHWHILPEWIEQTRAARGAVWHDCRMVLRLYDVTSILFNGFNAHRLQDVQIADACGQQFVALPHPGTTQLAEAGFLLKNGEFIPAARSRFVQFPPSGVSTHGEYTALLVAEQAVRQAALEQAGQPAPQDHRLRVEKVAGGWEQARELNSCRRIKLRTPLRIASFAFEAAACGQQGLLANYVSELAGGLCALGHAVHVFVP